MQAHPPIDGDNTLRPHGCTRDVPDTGHIAVGSKCEPMTGVLAQLVNPEDQPIPQTRIGAKPDRIGVMGPGMNHHPPRHRITGTQAFGHQFPHAICPLRNEPMCHETIVVRPDRRALAHSHHIPSKGSTNGTHTYPAPNPDQTVASGNAAGSKSDQLPTAMTPTNSKLIAAAAIVRRVSASANVATQYTRAAIADITYASGASCTRVKS